MTVNYCVSISVVFRYNELCAHFVLLEHEKNMVIFYSMDDSRVISFAVRCP